MTLRVYGPTSNIRMRDGAESPASGGAYMERLVKLVPAEVVPIYPLLMNEAKGLSDVSNQLHAIALVSWIVLAIVIVLRWQATSTPERGAQWLAVGIAAISYILWVYVLGGYFGIEGWLHMWPSLDPGAAVDPDTIKFKNLVGSLALVSWTLVIPAVYKGDTR